MEAGRMSTIKVDTIQSTGGAPRVPAKAIAQFDGTGTATLNTDQNISSLTDNGTGDYTLGLSNANSGTTPSVVFGSTGASSTYEFAQQAILNGSTVGGTDPTTSSIRIATGHTGNGQTDQDCAYVSVAIFE